MYSRLLCLVSLKLTNVEVWPKDDMSFRKYFSLSVIYVLSVIQTILILANLNRGFPEFPSTSFRNILTLSGSSKIRLPNLSVFEVRFGLKNAATFSLWECDKACI